MTEWQIAKLSELATIKYGKNQKDVTVECGNIPIYGTGGIMGYASKALYDKPSVLIGRKGTIDKVRYVTKPFWTVDTTFYTIIDDSKILPRYFYYLLSLVDLSLYNEGTTIPSLRTETLNRLEFYLPPLEIQNKIVSILGALDDKIELNQRQNNNLEQQAQAIFKSIYRSENNGILADIVDIAESGNRPKGGALSQGIPSIGAENIEKFGVYDYSKEKFISEEFYNQMKRGKVLSEDVLLYKDGAYTGKVSLALDGFPHKVCAVNEHVFIIRGKPNISSQFFIYFCLSYETNKNYLHTLACSKAAQPGLNQSELLGLPIFIPLPDIVKKFTNTVSPLMHKIAANAIENIKLATLRDTLLPKLMKGEIDVSNVDISALTSTDKLSFTED